MRRSTFTSSAWVGSGPKTSVTTRATRSLQGALELEHDFRRTRSSVLLVPTWALYGFVLHCTNAQRYNKQIWGKVDMGGQ